MQYAHMQIAIIQTKLQRDVCIVNTIAIDAQMEPAALNAVRLFLDNLLIQMM